MKRVQAFGIRRLLTTNIPGLTLSLLLGMATPALAVVPITQQMGLDQKIGAQVPMNVPFKDEHGKDIQLGDLLGKRPALLVPIFYRCDGVCSQETSQILKMVIKFKQHEKVGRDFDIVFLSIHPKETPELARAKQKVVLDLYKEPDSEKGWHFLTGKLDNICKVTDAVGFRYAYDVKNDLINHPAGVMMLTPRGKVSQYFYGTAYPTVLFKESIKTAALEKDGVKAEAILLGCIMIDPVTGKRSIVVKNVLAVSGIFCVIVLVCGIVIMTIQDRRARKDA